MSRQFEDNLAYGHEGETITSRWLVRRGNLIVPAFDIKCSDGRGPRVLGIQSMISPDILVFGAKQNLWVEVKRKSVFSWYRATGKWVTGIDIPYWDAYKEISERTKMPLWIMFLQCDSMPSDGDQAQRCPSRCPTGLFGQSADLLKSSASHTSTRWGKSGMIYWAHSSFKHLATLSDMGIVDPTPPIALPIISPPAPSIVAPPTEDDTQQLSLF
jgi:hypothetical protein